MRAKPASSTGTQDAPVSNKQEIPDSNTEDTASEAESTPTQAPVTLTISVVGDCTLAGNCVRSRLYMHLALLP